MDLEAVRRSYPAEIGIRAKVRSQALLTALAEAPRERVRGTGYFISEVGARFIFSNIPFSASRDLFLSCTILRDANTNQKLLEAFSKRAAQMGEVRSTRLDSHEEGLDCWLHTEPICLSRLAIDYNRQQ